MQHITNRTSKNISRRGDILSSSFSLLTNVSLIAVGILCIVLPNSFKEISVFSILIATIFALLSNKVNIYQNRYFFLFLLINNVVTSTYILVGLANGATEEAAYQTIAIYVLFPACWGVISCYINNQYDIKFIARALIVYLLVAYLSVAYYFYAYRNLGPDYVRFLVEDPNVDIREEGYVAAIMYVYGSLIFLVAGIFSAPYIIKSPLMRMTVLITGLIVVFSSGRGALILAIPIGMLFSLLGVNSNHDKNDGISRLLRGVFGIILSVILIILVLQYAFYTFGLDFTIAINNVIEKLLTRGGAGRYEQSFALVDGITANLGLGSGHGMGVSYYVDYKYPWRYELVWLATIYRVGLIGAFFYSLPFFIALYVGLKRIYLRLSSPEENLLLGGFVSAFIASNTNPYIEAIVFQWMYVFPVVYFLRQRGVNRRDTRNN